MDSVNEALIALFKDIARDMRAVRLEMQEVTRYMKEAESEVPEKMRRFIMYMHDAHDVMYLYEERGLAVPPHILREVERCDDRFRHLLDDLNMSGATFEQVRREMTKREGNRWDHSAMLPKTEKAHETGHRKEHDGGDEGRAQAEGGERGPGSGPGPADSPHPSPKPDVQVGGVQGAHDGANATQVRVAREALRRA